MGGIDRDRVRQFGSQAADRPVLGPGELRHPIGPLEVGPPRGAEEHGTPAEHPGRCPVGIQEHVAEMVAGVACGCDDPQLEATGVEHVPVAER
jgi:hypothetical protein